METRPLSWLWAQFQDFAFGIALIFSGTVLVAIIRGFATEPGETARKIAKTAAWAFSLLVILWVATQY